MDVDRWERTWMHRLTCRFGHRAMFIWLISMAWVFQGVVVAFGVPQGIDHLFHTHLPIPVRASFWLIPALVSMAISRSSKEWVAFVLVAIAPAQRCASYWVGAVATAVDDPGNYVQVWDYVGRGLIYFLIILMMWLVGTWPNEISPVRLAEIEETWDAVEDSEE